MAVVVAIVGATIVMSASPYVAVTPVQENVGMALLTVNVAVVDAVVKFTLSAGLKVAVMVEEPPPVIDAVEPFVVATEVWDEE